ncbi:MAG TPA: hypothetical protein VKB88_27535 [Bryobacteraceae bacterium]|nr:hypothetical protein [Bryobacteraceae bacterium]
MATKGGTPFNDDTPGVKYTFAVSQPDVFHLELKSDKLFLKLRRLDASIYPLFNRGFHWINELPYNR